MIKCHKLELPPQNSGALKGRQLQVLMTCWRVWSIRQISCEYRFGRKWTMSSISVMQDPPADAAIIDFCKDFYPLFIHSRKWKHQIDKLAKRKGIEGSVC